MATNQQNIKKQIKTTNKTTTDVHLRVGSQGGKALFPVFKCAG